MESITEVISSHVRLYNHKNLKIGCCPFHKETAPSLIVYPAEGRFICLSCGESGDQNDFIAKLHAKDTGAAIESSQGDERLYAIMKSAAGYYSWRLHSEGGKVGMEYFQQRGLTEETIEKFSLGLAGKFGNRLLTNLKKWGYTEQEADQAGLILEKEDGEKADRFWDRVMFPLKDENGRVIGFTGRALSGDAVKKMKYCNTPETEIFQKRETLYGLDLAKDSAKDYFILCEGNMDVIAMHQTGFDNAVASCGTALTKEQCRKMKAYKKRVMLMYDSDEPGVTSTVKAIRLLRDEGLEVVVTDLYPSKDPDELLMRFGREEMLKRIKSSMHATKFIVKNASPSDALQELLLNTNPEEYKKFI